MGVWLGRNEILTLTTHPRLTTHNPQRKTIKFMFNKTISKKILEQIKKSRSILLAFHVSPDPDCLSSVLAMNLFLKSLGKETKIISYSKIPPKYWELPGMEVVDIEDFANQDFKKFDLFIALDMAQDWMITRSEYPKSFPKEFKIINIDHHTTNPNFGDINLVAPLSSTAELLYNLFKDWKVEITKEIADLLMLGIFADTGCFQYPMTTPETLRAAAELMEKGASIWENVVYNFRSYNFLTLKYWGKILENIKMDISGKFVWSTISKEEREELEIEPTEIQDAASNFAPIVEGTEFGIILNEESENLVRGSMRSRDGFDVSKIAVALGGGGHKQAAGFTVKANLAEAEKKVLEIARKLV